MQSVADIRVAVAGGLLSPAAVLAEAEARHRQTHARLNALVQARFGAAAVEAPGVAGPLAGVPVSVKDCFAVAGLRTTLGIANRREATDAADAPLVARLRGAGAIVVGKANVPQAMLLHETVNPVWGRTNHPRDPSRGPGGSSGGDAAAVAAGVVPLALGNDLAGSLRQPAHVCGIATIMPRSTALGDGGAFATLPHLTAVRPRAGFLARTVADLRLALGAVGVPAAALPERPLTIGWWDDAGPIPASPAIQRGVRVAVERLAAAGATVKPLDGGLARDAAWLLMAIVSADGGADIRRLFGTERAIHGVARLLRLARMPRGVRPLAAAVARLCGRGIEAEALARTGPRDADAFAELLAAREALRARSTTEFAGIDAIVCPVSALPALRHGTAARLVLAAAPCLLANLLELPAGAVPVTSVEPDEERSRRFSFDPVLRAAAATDRGSRGLPVGVQVVGGPGADESVVLDVMETIERGAADPASRITPTP